METELLVNFSEFWSRLREDIARAEESVLIQTFALEGDSVGKQLAGALLSCSAYDRRILADSFTRIVLSDRFRFSPTNFFEEGLRCEARETSAMMSRLKSAGVTIKFTNPWGPSPRKLLSRNHKKVIVIDDRVAYIGGVNFSEHNAAWHDMMLRITANNAVAFLRHDFLSTWTRNNRFTNEQFGGGQLFCLDGRENWRAFERVLDLIDGARRTIFVESPYITFPFYERLREAARRGVDVKLVTPEQNNWRHFTDYARLESARSQIDLRLYRGGMIHLKAMLVDDQYLIAGSSNFDYLSYRLHQEIVAIFRDPHLINEFRARVMLPDLARSTAVNCHASAVSKRWLGLQARVLDATLTILT